MKKHNILKRFLIPGSLVSFISLSAFAVSCEVRTKTPNTTSSTSETESASSNNPNVNTPEDKPTIDLGKTENDKNTETVSENKPNLNNPETKPIDTPEDVPVVSVVPKVEKTKEKLNEILYTVEIKSKSISNKTVNEFDKTNVEFSNYDADKYEVILKDIERINADLSVKLALVLKDKTSNMESDIRTFQISGFKQLPKKNSISTELTKVKIDYPNKQETFASEAKKELFEVSGFDKNYYEVQIIKIEKNLRNPAIIMVSMFIKDKETKEESNTVQKIIVGFKSEKKEIDLNAAAKLITFNVEGKENIVLGRSDLSKLKVTSNVSNEYNLIIKEKRATGTTLNIKFVLTKKNDSANKQSLETTYKLTGFKRRASVNKLD